MSLIQRQGTGSDQHPSPVLGINLASNNPFRNRATSPANSLPSPVVANFNGTGVAPDRPISKNPFLDQSETRSSSSFPFQPASPQKTSLGMDRRGSPSKKMASSNVEEMFDNLNLDNGPRAHGTTSEMAPTYLSQAKRSENIPPNGRNGHSAHHISRSQEEDRRARNLRKDQGPQEQLNIFADPQDQSRLRPRMRSNSESSIGSRLLTPEEEKKRKERQRREREARHRDGKGRAAGHKSKKPSQRLDIIDSLDVTSIYGTGLFHHDGPFDACNPDRNRRGARRAPMEAFAKGSANMALGGSGPVNKNIDFNQFHGRGAEGFTDFSTSGKQAVIPEPITYEPQASNGAAVRQVSRPGVDRASSFDPVAKADQVHGEESLGLGTSTFLDGAPAPRAAIQRRDSETETPFATNGGGGGLGRKRSLAQKIRGINNPRSGRVTSPENAGLMHRSNTTTSPPDESQSAGGMPRIRENDGTNPFFHDYDEAYDKKGAKIQIAEERNRTDRSGSIGGGEEEFNATARARAVSSPKRGAEPGNLERRVTNDGTTSSVGPAESSGGGGGGGGFLSRVKSLKSGKRGRPDKVAA